MKPLWEHLQAAGAEIILNGHAHDFECFEPRLPNGVKDPNGIAEIVIGTGGPVDPMLDAPRPGATFGDIRMGMTPGILKLTLGKGAWRRDVITTANTFAAHGSGTCH